MDTVIVGKWHRSVNKADLKEQDDRNQLHFEEDTVNGGSLSITYLAMIYETLYNIYIRLHRRQFQFLSFIQRRERLRIKIRE